jgi:hypothetical protein
MARRTQQEWLALIKQHQSSGLTVKAFSAQHHINANYFSKRRCEFQRLQSVSESSSFIQLQPQTQSATPSLISLGYGSVQLKLSTSVSPQWPAGLLKELA